LQGFGVPWHEGGAQPEVKPEHGGGVTRREQIKPAKIRGKREQDMKDTRRKNLYDRVARDSSKSNAKPEKQGQLR